jgi:hypothetical protein
MRRLRERQSVSLAVPTKDIEPTDVGCVMLLAEGDTALLQTVDPNGVEIVDPVDGVAVLGFQHDNRLVMLRGTARQLTPSLFSFQVMDGVGVRQLRSRTRLPVRVPVVVSAHGATEIHGCTTDLSCSGAALELRVPPLGSRFTLTLQLPDGGEPVVVDADVVRQTPVGLAVHFSEISHALALRIESFILTEKARAVWLAA